MVPGFDQNFEQTVMASNYADKFEGQTTANGEKYHHPKLTAAHKSLPFGTILKVKSLKNGKEVIVRINDSGPFIKDRIIDLSKFAAIELDFVTQGTTKVQIFSIGGSKEQ